MQNKYIKIKLFLLSMLFSSPLLAAAEENLRQIKNLPMELLHKIFIDSNLSANDVFQISAVCKYWRELTKTETEKIKNLKVYADQLVIEKSDPYEALIYIFLTDWIFFTKKESKYLVEYIIQNYQIDISQLLSKAVKNNLTHAVKWLLSLGATTNYLVEPTGIPPLCYSAVTSKLEMTKILLDHDADINMRSKNGDTPLQAARKIRITSIGQLTENTSKRYDAIIKLLEEAYYLELSKYIV